MLLLDDGAPHEKIEGHHFLLIEIGYLRCSLIINRKTKIKTNNYRL